jgi:nicotinate-nucleotide adenylyltransferase
METLGFLRPGMTVGLLGGSFDPPHKGHVRITRAALRRFGLDRVVWLVSPGNPLKVRGPAPIDVRITAARDVMRHPRVIISDFEARVGTRFTAQTIERVQKAHPGVNFVWLMGADNLVQFSQWQRFEDIMSTIPVGVLARPGKRISARLSKTARLYRHAQIRPESSRLLARCPAPAWCFLNLPMVDQSSSEIRAKGGWTSG